MQSIDEKIRISSFVKMVKHHHYHKNGCFDTGKIRWKGLLRKEMDPCTLLPSVTAIHLIVKDFLPVVLVSEKGSEALWFQPLISLCILHRYYDTILCPGQGSHSICFGKGLKADMELFDETPS